MNNRKCSMLLICVLALGSFCRADNLLKNYGFEDFNPKDGPGYWQTTMFPKSWWFDGRDRDAFLSDASEKYAGNYSFKIENKHRSFARVGQEISLPPGKYIVSGMIKGPAGMKVLAEIWDTRCWKLKIQPDDILFENGIATGEYRLANAEWQRFSFVLDVPRAYKEKLLFTVGTYMEGSLFVDDVSLAPFDGASARTNEIPSMISNCPDRAK